MSDAIHRNDKRKRCDMAFTLIELLVVLAIIGILTGLIVGMADFAKRKAREGRARTEMNLIAKLLDDYLADHGKYPEGKTIKAIQAIVSKDLPEGADCRDPWDNLYEYRCDKSKPLVYELYSRGRDGNKGNQPHDDVYPER